MTPLRCLLLALYLGLSLAACSRIALVYSNLDWLIPWRLDSYLDLDRDQQAWLEPRLHAHLHWHCSSELPHYLDWLRSTQRIIEQPEPSAEALDAQLIEIDAAFARIGREIAPTAIALLQSLDDKQVAELFATFEKTNREAREKLLDPPLAIQIEERQERLEKRLRPWLGRLNDRQKAHIKAWAETLGEYNSLWLDNRLRLQHELRAALQARGSPDFAARLHRLLQDRDNFYDATFRQAYTNARQATARLLSQLLVAADREQRQHLSERLNDLRHDLGEQRCASPTAD
nr:DUF6279 family lipoprotein [uncultured Pseudomonas sp.]